MHVYIYVFKFSVTKTPSKYIGLIYRIYIHVTSVKTTYYRNVQNKLKKNQNNDSHSFFTLFRGRVHKATIDLFVDGCVFLLYDTAN